jgi:RNA polymerase sigma-70 factor, ECF subfamily
VDSQPVVPETARSGFGVRVIRMDKLSDEDLMEQLRQGHPDALPILFDRFYRLVLRIALRILRDPGEAEDLMQDVFFEVFNKAAMFDPAKGSTKTWIVQYAYHRSLNRRQYLTLRNFYGRNQIMEIDVSESSSLDIAWRGLTFREWRRMLDQGLATLSEKQRRTLEMACFQGLLLSEIAEQTKESLPNVRHNYYRGLKGLKKILQVQSATAEPSQKVKGEGNDAEP